MREYMPTVAGEQLAAKTGLHVLTERLISRDCYYDSPILVSLTQEPHWMNNDIEHQEVDKELASLRSGLKGVDEKADFDKALSIEEGVGRWRYLGDWEQDTLVPVRSVNNLAGTTDDDSLVLSGAAGLSLLKYRNQCPLLSRSHYAEYGFKTFNEACAFVGAYAVGKFIANEHRRLRQKTPSFQFTKDHAIHSISVGGSIHGDFEISETRIPEDVLSPINTLTAFAPRQELAVLGYHSIEPEIVATLIEAEFLRDGKEAARQLVNEFIFVMHELADPNGKIATEMGNFGDYGQGDPFLSLISLSILLAEKDFNPTKHHTALHSTPYAPQSSVMFEMAPTETGVRFQNRSRQSQKEASGIEIDRGAYAELFGALIKQASGGHGRSAPHQLISLVFGAKALLDGQKLEDLYER